MTHHASHFLLRARQGAALALIAILAGSASALFLWLLDVVGGAFGANAWLLLLLPVAGLLSGLAYHRYGSDVEGGNNRILQELHDPKSYIPLRMAPMVLLGTLATHLCGGSAGREGTAVQMGGALSDQVAKGFGLSGDGRKMALLAGVAAGFSSLFGTPLAGAVFALEFVVVGHLRLAYLLPCLLASLAADRVCLAWGAHHTHYAVSAFPELSVATFFAALAGGVAFGLAARLFVAVSHGTSRLVKSRIAWAPARPALGGIAVAICIALAGTRYAGLGVPVISESFVQPVLPWDFLIKLLLTALTVGVGFKGGEVTPLFFVGATLGNALAPVLGLPFPLLAAMGLAAVFGAAANTPLACIVMAMELFGADIGPYAALACVAALWASGNTGIYTAQKRAN
ncbi:MAG TPA: chloride channel protein [Fibrobacteria bacterium]|nr:chloride channel protein [Fibrobacteria bacterium]